MLKNESARNTTKPVPLRLSRLSDSGGIFTLSNGVRMEKISHSVQKVKQAKKIVDCAVRTDADVACLYADVVGPYNDMWQLQVMTRVKKNWTFGHTAGPIPR
jgi:hypothetical protein